MVSWTCIAYYLHQVLTCRGYRRAYYCRTAPKPNRTSPIGSGDCTAISPTNTVNRMPSISTVRLWYIHDGPDKPPTAWIIPQASEQAVLDAAASKMRSETWTAVLLDEAAFMRNLKELVKACSRAASGSPCRAHRTVRNTSTAWDC